MQQKAFLRLQVQPMYLVHYYYKVSFFRRICNVRFNFERSRQPAAANWVFSLRYVRKKAQRCV